MNESNGFKLTFNGIVGLIMTIGFFVLLFFIAKGVFQLLAWVAPFLILGALIINYQTVVGFLKYIWNLILTRPLMGILGVLLTVIGFPVVAGILFGKSMLDRRLRQYIEQQEAENAFTEYEEVTEDADVLELPTIEKPAEERSNPYTDYLDKD